MNGRPIPLALGGVAFAVGLATASGYATLELPELAIVVVGLVAILVGASAVDSRRDVREYAETPEPERRVEVPTPGETLSDAVDPFLSKVNGHRVHRNRISDGLHSAAVAVLTRFEGLSEEEAHRRIDDGTWTDDGHAAAFLSSSLESPSRSGRQFVVDAMTGGTAFRNWVRHTVPAIAAVGYGERRVDRELPQFGREDDDTVSRTSRTHVDGITLRTERPTGHWVGVGTVALLAVGVGAIAESAAVVLAGVVGVGYAGFARASSAPIPQLAVERAVDDTSPDLGEEVDVTVILSNEGDSFVSDLRFVDGVPSGLAVVEGSPRVATALRPGESVTLEYTVTARRGRHTFDPALAVVRDLSRSTERVFLVADETELVTEPSVSPLSTPVALRRTAATFAGRLSTDEGGSGTEFHSVREYRPSDPLNRIDWNRHARTGDLATLEFREERAAQVVVLVDARAGAYLAPDSDSPHAVDRSVDAAARIAASLLDRGDAVGLTALGPNRDGNLTDPCWLAPSSGHDQLTRFRELLATHPQFDTDPAREATLWLTQLRTIRRRLPAASQVVFLTPLCDRSAIVAVRQLEARGHPVTVVSPDPTADRTASQQLARVARRVRRFDVQRVGVPVVDWAPDETIDEAFARANAGGRQ